ncbi:LysR family transcriptional regulator [Pandoraea pnomenusa]|uniref:LysR family transcriptional regulator n=1 Tax=Pandoraea pnomenusa TaxID=93220 RepID=UPI00174A8817|nr:LysR family transcriptional regulator [Pandoraea pnomenusa]
MNVSTGQAPPSRLKLKYLQVVAVLDETHSLAKAADHLNLTRAALSKTLAGLEALLGVKLYERTASGVVPTAFGRTLARHARLILGNLRSAEDELRDLMNEHRQSLAVGALFVAMPQLLPQAIALIAQSDPRCVITVRESGSFGLAAGLHDGSFDLVVGRLVPEYFRSAVNLEPLFEEELLVICRSGHPLAKAPTLTWREAAKYPWMLPPKESPISHAIQSQFLADGVQGPAVIVEAFSIPLALGMLQSCDAMTVLPSRLACALRDKGEVSILSLRSPRLPAPMGVAWRKDSPLSPLASAFIAALKTCAGEPA